MEHRSQRETWEDYSACWAETDAGKRGARFAHCLSPECTYLDPRAKLDGYDGLSAYIAELQKNVPGVRFVVTDFKEHHGRSLASWDMLDGKGAVLSRGASFGLYAPDGRLVQMNGFY